MAANSEKTPKKRGRGRPFEKGQSGNPRGRPKQTQAEKDALEIMRAAAPEAARMLAEMAISPDTRADLRVKCAEIVMDRVYGRASQPIDGHLGAEIHVVMEGFEEMGG